MDEHVDDSEKLAVTYGLLYKTPPSSLHILRYDGILEGVFNFSHVMGLVPSSQYSEFEILIYVLDVMFPCHSNNLGTALFPCVICPVSLLMAALVVIRSFLVSFSPLNIIIGLSILQCVLTGW